MSAEAFENYLLEHFMVQRVSNGTQLLLDDECPFCSSHGRVYIDRKKCVGICHKCGQGFGAVSFISAHQAISRSQARKVLDGGADSGWKDLETEQQAPEGMAVWFPPTVPIMDSPEATAYLEGRGISPALLARFGLTFCRENVQIGDKLYWTSNRIIIPLFNQAGQAVGWQGRDVTGESKIRYLFMPGFRGADNLYNVWALKPGGYVMLVEGAFDVYGWVRAGVNNVAGTYGKKISAVQVDKLAALEPELLLVAWDGDAAAEKYRFVEQYGHRFPQIRMIDLGGQDADECDKKALLTAVSRASSYRWEDKMLTLLSR